MTALIPIIPSSEITPRDLFYNRRHFLQLAAGATLASLLPHSVLAGEQLANVKKATESLSDELTPLKDITSYNNFYEFGTGKEDPAQNAGSLKTHPGQLPWKAKSINLKYLIWRNC